jgi:hypothetical protein
MKGRTGSIASSGVGDDTLSMPASSGGGDDSSLDGTGTGDDM